MLRVWKRCWRMRRAVAAAWCGWRLLWRRVSGKKGGSWRWQGCAWLGATSWRRRSASPGKVSSCVQSCWQARVVARAVRRSRSGGAACGRRGRGAVGAAMVGLWVLWGGAGQEPGEARCWCRCWLWLGCCRVRGFVSRQLSLHRFLIAGSFRPWFAVWSGGCGGLGAVVCWSVRGWGLWCQWCAGGGWQ